ncbi:MAG: 50S ribosomal protein L20 [Bacteroidota bacterium]|nr:50S ribosomal protein L20 [Bacteroidota bacterium]
MPRVKRGFKARRRRKKILKLAKGYRGARSILYKTAKETVHRAWCYAYRDRRQKKREFRKLWIIRINAACREQGVSYSQFMGKLAASEMEINRKVLADLAMNDPKGFNAILKQVMKG